MFTCKYTITRTTQRKYCDKIHKRSIEYSVTIKANKQNITAIKYEQVKGLVNAVGIITRHLKKILCQ